MSLMSTPELSNPFSSLPQHVVQYLFNNFISVGNQATACKLFADALQKKCLYILKSLDRKKDSDLVSYQLLERVGGDAAANTQLKMIVVSLANEYFIAFKSAKPNLPQLSSMIEAQQRLNFHNLQVMCKIIFEGKELPKLLPLPQTEILENDEEDKYTTSIKALDTWLQQPALKRMGTLGLHESNMTAMPAEISHLKQLKEITASSNFFITLPKEIVQLTKLTELNLGNNKFNKVPQAIFQLSKLTQLGLNHNKITEIPKEIELIKRLAQLDMHHNCLEQLSDELCNLKNLQALELSENCLQQLPKQMGKMRKLTALHIDHNQISSLPQQLNQLHRLCSISLKNNPLPPQQIAFAEETCKKCMEKMKQLQKSKPGVSIK